MVKKYSLMGMAFKNLQPSMDTLGRTNKKTKKKKKKKKLKAKSKLTKKQKVFTQQVRKSTVSEYPIGVI